MKKITLLNTRPAQNHSWLLSGLNSLKPEESTEVNTEQFGDQKNYAELPPCIGICSAFFLGIRKF